jgi:predicted Rossmann fold nucleotide-binding protein DprA/Smf involved in DNA uptake
MKSVLICGSRDASTKLLQFADTIVKYCKDKGYSVICGDALGVDSQCVWSCSENDVPYTVYGIKDKPRNDAPIQNYVVLRPARTWEQRDIEMVKRADTVICIWNGVSKGTLRVAKEALAQNKPVQVYRNGVKLNEVEINKVFKEFIE